MPPKLHFCCTIFLISLSSSLWACSCALSSFCEVVREYDQVALQVKPIRQVLYTADPNDEFAFFDDQQAVYLEVLEIYQSDIQLTDTIKIYGSSNSAACELDVHRLFPVGETIIATFSGWHPTYINNPDAAKEDYVEANPNSCTTFLGTVNGAEVEGFFGGQGLTKMPIKTLLKDCGLDETDACGFSRFKVFPNPSFGEKTILFNPRSTDIQQLNIYNSAGQLFVQQTILPTIEPENIPLPVLPKGVHFIEIISATSRCVEKVMVLK